MDRERVSQSTLKRLRAGEDIVIVPTFERIEAIAVIDRDAGLYLYNARDASVNVRSLYQR
jgi:two-component system nitrogen regulation sensor histidine kinase NtrY